MHGVINQAIEDMARQSGVPDAWELIKRRAGVDIPAFIGMDAYPDCITYQLIAAAGEVLGLDHSAVLEAFGEHWLLFTQNSGYAPFLATAGQNFPELLQNLEGLHARMRLVMPGIRPPVIRCTVLESSADGSGALRLAYHSERAGLAPMVVGLIRGLGRRFGLAVEITHSLVRGAGADHDEFDVAYRAG